MAIPKTMKAARIIGTEKIEIQEVPVPELWDENTLLLETKAVGICNQTDTHILEGSHIPNGPEGTSCPFTLGHEICGQVVKKGSNVKDIEIGDLVSVRGWFSSGGFAQYTLVNRDYIKMPKEMTWDDGALMEMLAAVWYMTEQVLRIGDTVTLLGCGGAGSYFVKLLKAGGATKIIVSEPHPAKRQWAMANGAHYVIDPSKENVLEKVKEYTGGRKTDVVIDAAGMPDTIRIFTSLVARRGRIGMFGVCTVPTVSDFYQIHENATAIFSAGYDHDYDEYGHIKCMDLVSSGVIKIDDLVTHRATLEELPSMLKMIRDKKENIRKIMIYPNGKP